MKRGDLLSTVLVIALSSAQGYGQNVITNPGFEDPWTPGTYAPCTADIPQWLNNVNWAGGYNRVKCELNDPGPAFQSFPNAENPPSWNNSPANTGYVRWRSTNITAVGHTNFLIKSFAAPLAGGTYTLRFKYATYRASGPNNVVLSFRAMATATTPTCATNSGSSVASGTFTVTNTALPVTWSTYSATVTIPAGTRGMVFAYRVSTFPTDQFFALYLDEFSLVPLPVQGGGQDGNDIGDDPQVDMMGTTADLWAYPNPASDRLNLSLLAEVEGAVTVSFTNLTGQVVSVQQFQPNSILEVDVSKLPPGPYAITATAVGYRSQCRFLKE